VIGGISGRNLTDQVCTLAHFSPNKLRQLPPALSLATVTLGPTIVVL